MFFTPKYLEFIKKIFSGVFWPKSDGKRVQKLFCLGPNFDNLSIFRVL